MGLTANSIRIPKISTDGTITTDDYLKWNSTNRELIIGASAASGNLSISSNAFTLSVQDNIISGQSNIVFNFNQENALSLKDKSGVIYMTYKSVENSRSVIFKEDLSIDKGIFSSLVKTQGSITTNGAGVKVYAMDRYNNIIQIPFIDNMTGFFEIKLLLKSSNLTRIICAEIKANIKRISGTLTITQLPIEIVSNYSTAPNFNAGIESYSSNSIAFFYTPDPADTTLYSGAFTEISYSIN